MCEAPVRELGAGVRCTSAGEEHGQWPRRTSASNRPRASRGPQTASRQARPAWSPGTIRGVAERRRMAPPKALTRPATLRRWSSPSAVDAAAEERLDVVLERHQQAGMAIPPLEAQLDGPIGDPVAGRVTRSLAVVLDPRHEVVVWSPTRSGLSSKGAFQALTRMASSGEMKASCAALSGSWTSVCQLQSRLDGTSVQSGGWPTVNTRCGSGSMCRSAMIGGRSQ